MKPRIGVLTSGGDCPGLNAVLRAVVLAADKLGWEVVGFRDGFEGLLPPGNHVILDRQAVNGIMALVEPSSRQKSLQTPGRSWRTSACER
jgi:6-phosphofructokinase